MFKEYDIFSLQRVSSQFIGLVNSFLLLNLDSDFASENTELVIQNNQCHRFPLKGDSRDDNRYADEDEDPRYTSTSAGHSRLRRRSQLYADHSDGGSKSCFAGMSCSCTKFLARRSRKAFTSAARDFVRAVIHDKLEADSVHEKLERSLLACY